MHPHLHKKVRWYCGSESGTGTLMAVNCDDSDEPHLVQRDDGKGWELWGGADRYDLARSQAKFLSKFVNASAEDILEAM